MSSPLISGGSWDFSSSVCYRCCLWTFCFSKLVPPSVSLGSSRKFKTMLTLVPLFCFYFRRSCLCIYLRNTAILVDFLMLKSRQEKLHVQPYLAFLCFIYRYRGVFFFFFFFFKLKVCNNPVYSKSCGAIFLTTFSHFLFLCDFGDFHSISNCLIIIVLVMVIWNQWLLMLLLQNINYDSLEAQMMASIFFSHKGFFWPYPWHVEPAPE